MTEREESFDQGGLSEDQIQELWNKFYPRLRASIAERVQRIQRPVASHSEIALSAFHSLVRRVNAAEYPDLSNEDQFWSLLRTIAIRKANDVHKTLWAQKRGGAVPTLGQSQTPVELDSPDIMGLVPDQRSSHEVDTEVSEVFNRLLDQLPDDRYRDVILLKLQGADTETIAECLATTQRTVQRLLKSIRNEWEDVLH